jgi:single-stranded-DNA-specific exonuclease
VIALNNGVGKASCRSVRGIDFGSKIIEAKNQQLIVSGGGHAMAAGFTVEKDKLLQLHQFLSDMFKQDMARSNIHLHEYYNAELTTNAVNLELMEELTKLEPYGAGNNEPIFKFSNLFVLKADIVGGKHARLLLVPSKESYGSKPLSAIAFNVVHSSMQDIFFNKKPLDISVIGSLKLNQWQGKQRIQLQVRDVIL